MHLRCVKGARDFVILQYEKPSLRPELQFFTCQGKRNKLWTIISGVPGHVPNNQPSPGPMPGKYSLAKLMAETL
jgi:hypothetical protein